MTLFLSHAKARQRVAGVEEFVATAAQSRKGRNTENLSVV